MDLFVRNLLLFVSSADSGTIFSPFSQSPNSGRGSH